MFDSLKRGALRFFLLVGLGVLALFLSSHFPGLLGEIAAPVTFSLGLCFIGAGAGDLLLRILQPHVDPQRAVQLALRNDNRAAALIYLGRCLLAGMILIVTVTSARAASPPGGALPLLPVLKSEQLRYWGQHPDPATLGAQVEQETCITLSHRSCWSPKAELRTTREHGIGLGQLTRTFTSTGRPRFDSLQDLKRSFPQELEGFAWQTPYDPRLQLRALVLKDLQNFRLIQGVDSDLDRLAMTYAAYNGGLGGLVSDRITCRATPGCNQGVWFGHVEQTSLKARQSVAGYGKSFFQINREYVTNIMIVRKQRYTQLNSV